LKLIANGPRRFARDKHMDAPLADYFSNSAKSRVKNAIRMVDFYKGAVSGTMVADISQDQQTYRRCGPWLPALARKSILINFRPDDVTGHVFTERELGFAMGWPSIATSANDQFASVVGADFSGLPIDVQRSMQGNGMHLHQLASWLFYVHAHVLHRDVVMEFLPDLRVLGQDLPLESDEA
jgi:hypothetical protein